MELSEKEYLATLLKYSPSDTKRMMEGAQNVLVLWAISMLGVVIIWLLLAWFVGVFSDLQIGLKSQYAIWVVLVAFPICGLYSIISTINWLKNWKDHRPLLKKDITEGVVFDEKYQVKDVKRFQEQEHGGLIYFLRMSDDRVLVLYDYESQNQDGDPLASSFTPRDQLHIVRAPNSNYFISQKFSGEKILAPDTVGLFAPPEEWPEHDDWCDIPWDDLESRLSTEVAAAKADQKTAK